MYVACECRFSNTPFGPTRRYGSSSYPSTVTSVELRFVSSNRVPRSTMRALIPGTAGAIATTRLR